MKQAYQSPALQETRMDLRSAIAELSGDADGNHLGWGGMDDGSHDPDANSRGDWEEDFWESRE